MRPRIIPAILAALAVAVLPACGGGSSAAFSLTYPDNRAEDLDAVLSAISTAPPRQDPAVIVGAATDQVFAFDLRAGRLLWRHPAHPRSMPQLAGDAVVIHDEGGVVVRDLQSGAVRLTYDDEAMHLIGADGSGGVGAFVLSTGGGVGAHSRLVVLRDGSLDWDVAVDQALGVPAVLAGMVFVPWNNQNLSILDAASGREVARVRIPDSVIGTAFVRDNVVYVGQDAVYRIGPELARGGPGARFAPAPAELPGQPAFLVNAFQPPPTANSAVHSVRLVFCPAPEGPDLGLTDGHLYLAFYKLIFALDPSGEDVAWIYLHPRDIVGALAQPGGLWLVDDSGGVVFVGAQDGLVRFSGSIGVTPTSALVRAGDFDPSGQPQGASRPVIEQLLAAAQGTDARLVPARTLAITMLARHGEPEVTGHVITLCDDGSLAPMVRSAACESLAGRSSGAEQVMAALERHAAFLEGTRAPPVGALADAAARMGDTRVVPLLIAHLRDPETPSEDLPAVFAALKALGDANAAASIRDFLRLYHADDMDENTRTTLVAAIDALVSLTGPVARETLDEIATDPLAIVPVRVKAREAIAALDRQAAEAQQAEEQAGAEVEPPPEEVEPPAEAPPPDRITPAIMDGILGPIRRELTQCLQSSEGRPRSARIVMRVDGSGGIEQLAITPESVQGCLEPLIRARTYPANPRHQRQQIIHTLRR